MTFNRRWPDDATNEWFTCKFQGVDSTCKIHVKVETLPSETTFFARSPGVSSLLTIDLHYQRNSEIYHGSWGENYLRGMTSRSGYQMPFAELLHWLKVAFKKLHPTKQFDDRANGAGRDMKISLLTPSDLGFDALTYQSSALFEVVSDKLYLILSWHRHKTAHYFPLPLIKSNKTSSFSLREEWPSCHDQRSDAFDHRAESTVTFRPHTKAPMRLTEEYHDDPLDHLTNHLQTLQNALTVSSQPEKKNRHDSDFHSAQSPRKNTTPLKTKNQNSRNRRASPRVNSPYAHTQSSLNKQRKKLDLPRNGSSSSIQSMRRKNDLKQKMRLSPFSQKRYTLDLRQPSQEFHDTPRSTREKESLSSSKASFAGRCSSKRADLASYEIFNFSTPRSTASQRLRRAVSHENLFSQWGSPPHSRDSAKSSHRTAYISPRKSIINSSASRTQQKYHRHSIQHSYSHVSDSESVYRYKHPNQSSMNSKLDYVSLNQGFDRDESDPEKELWRRIQLLKGELSKEDMFRESESWTAVRQPSPSKYQYSHAPHHQLSTTKSDSREFFDSNLPSYDYIAKRLETLKSVLLIAGMK